MIEEALFKVDDDPKIRAHVLAEAADDQSSRTAVYPQGLHEEEKMWRIGSLRFWKSGAFKQLRSCNPFPSYRRASLTMDLFPDIHFEAEPFTTSDGRRAIAIVLRSEKNPKGSFGTFSVDEEEANRIISILNDEMDETRKLATERFRVSGGDPTRFASLRAPSTAEMFAQLDVFFGDPDEK
jgi:hypothetical protein